MDALPDFASLSDDDLDGLIRAAEDEEETISVRRRFLHERIDLLRGERVERLRGMVESGTLDLPAPSTLERPIFEGTGDPPEEHDESLPDPSTLSDDELRSLIIELEREEDDISLRRRMLHGQDRHPARRARAAPPRAPRRADRSRPDPRRLAEMSHVYCPECGFQNPEAANYCARCGAYLRRDEQGETTLSLGPEEIGEDGLQVGELRGPALVVRAGGGRAGESFEMAGLRTLIGRSPDCHVFLDDVTVSRRHAEIVREDDRYEIRDLGSLNGTFVNRHRIESAALSADDEVQIGKYRMTFLLP